MKYLITILLSILTLYAHAQTKIYTGKLGNAEIEMHLRFLRHEVYGYYFYKGSNELIALSGANSKDSKLKLFEYYDLDGSIYFDLAIMGKEMTGVRKGDDVNAKPFALTETGADSINKQDNIYCGDFRYENNKTRLVKDLTIWYINKTYIYFEIGVSFPDCTGNINGIMKATADHAPQFSRDDCQSLSFNLQEEAVKVKEEHCSPHGKTCDFRGTYWRLQE